MLAGQLQVCNAQSQIQRTLCGRSPAARGLLRQLHLNMSKLTSRKARRTEQIPVVISVRAFSHSFSRVRSFADMEYWHDGVRVLIIWSIRHGNPLLQTRKLLTRLASSFILRHVRNIKMSPQQTHTRLGSFQYHHRVTAVCTLGISRALWCRYQLRASGVYAVSLSCS